MLKNLNDTINKTCLIGLTYFDIDGNQLKQSMLTGTVIEVDKESGITLALATTEKGQEAPKFIIPSNLDCWFVAPKGDFHTSQEGVKVTNPDFLVTWDIYQTKSKDEAPEGEQQWWKWYPRTEQPKVG